MSEDPRDPTEYLELCRAAETRQLAVLGGFHPGPNAADLPPGTGTVILLGPGEPGFWPTVSVTPEFRDGCADPLDRWSRRIIGDWAQKIGARALFPFGGPPFLPFIRWAQRTGRVWPSPVTLLVHAEARLFLSLRGALALPAKIALPTATASPCKSCRDRPCRDACPVGAWQSTGYDVDACHAHLDSDKGYTCLQGGCLTRRACPVSRSYPRHPAQSAFHMRAFHGTRCDT